MTGSGLAAAVRRAALGIAAGAALLATVGTGAIAADDAALRTALRGTLQSYLDAHRSDEGISGISAFVSRSSGDPGLAAAVGTTLRGGRGGPMTRRTLVEIGSNTKAFTAARLLQLEAEGRLDIDQTVGDWLPQYPAWAGVSIRRLLNMTSGIPTYSEAPRFMKAQAADMFRGYTPAELVAYAYPTRRHRLPPNSGWFYSNTNYILPGMIVEKAGRAPFAEQLREHVFRPLGMTETYYSDGPLPQRVRSRMSGGYFWNRACSLYQPHCRKSQLAPLIGRNLQRADLTWAGAAGGIVSTPRDVAVWVRGLYGGAVVPPRQLREMQRIVSQATGDPIARTTAADPRGFGLGLGQMYQPGIGRFWFYEGETLGWRTVYGWYPRRDLVIVVSLNSQPDEDHVGGVITAIYDLLAAAE